MAMDAKHTSPIETHRKIIFDPTTASYISSSTPVVVASMITGTAVTAEIDTEVLARYHAVVHNSPNELSAAAGVPGT